MRRVMAETTMGRFACRECGRSYRWKPELAARKVKCKCGHIMVAPAQPPGEEDDLYDLVPESEPPKPKHVRPTPILALEESMKSGMGISVAPPPASAPAGPTSPVVGYAGAARHREPEIEQSVGGPLWREIFLPAALVLIGTAVQIAVTMYVGGGKWLSFGSAMPLIGARLGLNLVLSFAGIILAAKLMEISFGAIGPAILKLAAIALLVPGLSAMIGMLVGADNFFISASVASLVTLPLSAVGFKFLFDLDFGDAIYCVIIIWLVNDWLLPFAMQFLGSRFL
ncbi:MAG: hypothetical protein ACREJC_12720 [Tepidisphaeraceae bacterium]